MRQYLISALSQDAGKRLDYFLAEYLQHKNLGFSRTTIQKMISSGAVLSAEKSVTKPNFKVKAGDEFLLRLEEKKPEALLAEDIPLDVVYEDRDLAIINKQQGLVVHPAPGNRQHTMVNALLHRFKELSDINPGRPGIVHRLDKETSGLMVVAKNNFSHLELAAQFARHSIKRRYIALVKGRVEFNEDIIELPITRHPFKRENMSVGFTGKSRYAKTHYRTIRRDNNASLLELEPFTGRTHQLRVHLSFLGHPILGDTKYGKNNDFPRLALHAKYLGFVHPRTKKFIEFDSTTPAEFLAYCQKK